MIIAAIVLFFFAVILFWQANRQQRSAGLPGGKIIYSDTKDWGNVDKPFYDPMLGLTGKPDYVVKKRNQLIPVEVKSSRVTESPYDSHIFQLAAYCYLIEQKTGNRPQYGILHYPSRTFRVDYTQKLESALLDLISDIRYQERRTTVNRSHEVQQRCANCGYQENCNQSLA
jgi:CRISPR-associated exonuclease Cas4